MKKIGMIGGLSWVSTAEYYKRINEIMQERVGGVTSAKLVIESLNRQSYVSAVIDRRDEAAACRQVGAAAMALEAAGAEFIVISCNDVHRFVPELEQLVDIPFLHIASVTAAQITACGLTSVALLGVRKTMEESFYVSRLQDHGLQVIIPDESERTFIHESIFNELVHNDFRDSTRLRYQSIIKALGLRGAESVALACTEIPLLLSVEQSPLPAFSTTELHCRAAVDFALSNSVTPIYC